MISISTSHLRELLEKNESNISTIIGEKEKNVKNFLGDRLIHHSSKKIQKVNLKNYERAYIKHLAENFREVVLAPPKKLNSLKGDFKGKLNGSVLRKMIVNELLRRMGYSGLRKNFYPQFFQELPINTCVYCNSQPAISVTSKNGKRTARFQVDHFYPKSKYPCFSISFYNLFPSCQPCNGKKGSKKTSFQLHSNNVNDVKESNYKFRLDKKSIIKYKTTGIADSLKIQFTGTGSEEYDKDFDITGIYSTQLDIAEELVWMSVIYDKSYLQSLKNSFQSLYPKKTPMISRLVIGTYTSENEIHKRPLSKFRQDIARQLGLID